MQPWVHVLALVATISPSEVLVRDATGLAALGDNAERTVVLRFVNRRVSACSEPKEQVFRRKLACRSENQSATNTATLRFEPLVDPRRGVLHGDKRRAFSVELRHKNQPIEQTIGIAKGPWRVTWKEAARSVRADIENVAVSISLSRTVGRCRSGNWRCWLDTRPIEHRLEVSNRTDR